MDIVERKPSMKTVIVSSVIIGRVKKIAENVCCPILKVVKCTDTKEHKHLYCDPYHTVNYGLIDNDWCRIFCINQFKECKYFPKGE